MLIISSDAKVLKCLFLLVYVLQFNIKIDVKSEKRQTPRQ